MIQFNKLFSNVLGKIYLTIGFILVTITILISYILMNFNHSVSLLNKSIENERGMSSMVVVDGAFNQIELNTMAILTGIFIHNNEQVKRNINELKEDSELIDTELSRLRYLFPQYKDDYVIISELKITAFTNAKKMIEDSKNGNVEAQIAKVEENLAKYTDKASELMKSLQERLSLEQKKSAVKSHNNFIYTQIVTVFSSIFVMIFLFMFSFFIARTYILNPLTELKAGAKRIADGDFTHIIYIKNKGEFYDLAKQFNFMALKLNKVYQEQEEKIAIRTRDLMAANKHKSEFLSNMSHELRTPLNAIIGFSEIMSQEMFGDLNDKQKEYMNDITKSGIHLLSLINDILDLSKVEAGRMELHLTTLDMNHMIQESCSIVNEIAKSRSIKLTFNPIENLRHLIVDERKTKQIILNLVSNAIKFTPENGEVTIAIVDKTKYLEVSITDTGIGISEDDLKKLFQSFKQVGTDITKKAQGSGLGLVLAKQFIELHGGRIWVKSELKKGTSFIFSLPFPNDNLEKKEIIS